ncbi:hypothetical protein TRFO_33270 [Tritrichomonas foetus]|uniref:Importin N-terminal domain-containing protein n=1 Tax=Tritrichomonas foetus TaxID=1144522 RepID=A0A1J4JRI6_9EUKA|nr:hypothetical protein TRFO_33270 [Tritrichomonas foetus]|eukprot:OHT00142.1 hypothetical protein TRFO_33270 [Tritrichomonas foetus]
MISFTLADLQARVEILYSNCPDNNLISEADAYIREWQHSENVFAHCFEILSHFPEDANLDQKLAFIAIKTIQERIRFSYKILSPELLNEIINCLLTVIKKCENLPQSLHVQFALMSLADFMSINGNNLQAMLESIPDSKRILFLALFFESAQEVYISSYHESNQRVQFKYIPNGIELLSAAPLSVEWTRILKAITSIIPSYELLVSIIPRLFETLNDFDLIDGIVEWLNNIFSGTFKSFPPFLPIIIQFTTAYSQKLREIPDIQKTSDRLYIMWFSFFRIDDDSLLVDPNLFEILNIALTEFFECAKIMQIELSYWKDLLMSIIKVFEGFTQHPLNNFLFTLFQLCDHVFNQNIKNPEISQLDEPIQNLHLTSTEHLNYYLVNEEPKTFGMIKIAGMNSSSIDVKILNQFCELVLNLSDDISICCEFIGNVHQFCPEYLRKFIPYLLNAYSSTPLYASGALCKISFNYASEVVQINHDIVKVLINFLHFGKNPSRANLIISILNFIVHVDSPDVVNTVLNRITSFCIQFAQSVHSYIENFDMFAHFIANITSIVKLNPALSAFYNNFSIAMINALGDIIFSGYCQEWVCWLFKRFIMTKWLSDFNVVIQYIDKILEIGLFTDYHLVTFAPFLPPEHLPRFVQLINSINPEEFDLYTFGVATLIYKVATSLPSLVSEITPKTFSCLVKCASTPSQFDLVARAIEECIKTPLSHEVCLTIMQSCIQKAYRTDYNAMRLILYPLIYLKNQMNKEEYIQMFCSCLPFQNEISANFLQAILESGKGKSIEIKETAEKFISYFTKNF